MSEILYLLSGKEIDKKIDETWKFLEKKVKECRKCPLSENRTQSVFGEGSKKTELMFVGEGPGADEDLQGLPFVGKAGQLLNQIFAAAGIDRSEVYITNVVKCRPPQNRVPTVEECSACNDYLFAQISLVQPKILVTLGNTPTKWLLKTTQEGITQLRGKWFDWYGIKLMPMFHPSYLLRNQSRKVGSPRHLTWQDIQEVKARWDEIRQAAKQ
ncbi:uracil-DNA glycosylase [Acetomicrobium sp.]|uniref:uracil-DNA glycosylase n=1 Tax=Acetomicrobium sp. TaxID=1872099 RepID=UPI001BCBF7A9|nr:uracil-DNA glycosylase [Acetomicrobium sp.]